MTIKTYKQGRNIICHITEYNGKYTTKTGKPSDINCIAWFYDNLQEAEATALEYFNNFTKSAI